ncbi:YbaB/EbfC family nucleoid-associated protein [Saccharopolyspora shandongensis]|uniref:YbaB/EbfC family nucleoid-associated protein n=1 Tax=Saccharopolyspora shandongensis TaxID=418495 RepID=UPI0033C3279E
MDKALADINRKREEMAESQQELLDKTVSARSKDRMISATVKAGGALSKLEFHDERYRAMPKAELADAIVKVVEQARTQLQSEVHQVVGPQLGDIKQLREQLNAASPFADFLKPLLDVQQGLTDQMMKRQNGNG